MPVANFATLLLSSFGGRSSRMDRLMVWDIGSCSLVVGLELLAMQFVSFEL